MSCAPVLFPLIFITQAGGVGAAPDATTAGHAGHPGAGAVAGGDYNLTSVGQKSISECSHLPPIRFFTYELLGYRVEFFRNGDGTATTSF